MIAAHSNVVLVQDPRTERTNGEHYHAGKSVAVGQKMVLMGCAYVLFYCFHGFSSPVCNEQPPRSVKYTEIWLYHAGPKWGSNFSKYSIGADTPYTIDNGILNGPLTPNF